VYLMDNTFLGVRKFKRKGFIEGMETTADDGHGEAGIKFPSFHLPQNLQLDVEKFFELKPCPSVLHGEGVLGKMHIDEGICEGHEPVLMQYIHTDGIGYTGFEVGQQTRHHRPHGFGVEPVPFHGLGGVVVGFETLRHLRRHLAHRRQLRMNEVVDMLKTGRFAEEQVLDATLQFDILDTLKPHQFALVCTVEEGGAESLGFTDTDCVPFGHLTDNLHVRILVFQFGYLVKATAIDVFVRVLTHEIKRGVDPELFTKNVGTFGTDILTIRNISIC